MVKGNEMGDRASAEALRIAYEHTKAMGWKRSPLQIGRTAREILKGLEDTTP